MADVIFDYALIANRQQVAALATELSERVGLSTGKRGLQLNAYAQTAAFGGVNGAQLIVQAKGGGAGYKQVGVFNLPPDGSAMVIDIPLPAYNNVAGDNTRAYCELRAGAAEVYFTVSAMAY